MIEVRNRWVCDACSVWEDYRSESPQGWALVRVSLSRGGKGPSAAWGSDQSGMLCPECLKISGLLRWVKQEEV